MEEELTVDIDLRLYWQLFKQWFWLIVVAALLAGGVAYGVSRWMLTPIYQATVQVLIQPSSSYGTTEYQDVLTALRAASTYAEILKSRSLQEEALLSIGYTETQLEQFDQEGFPFELSVSPLNDTQVIEIKVEGQDRQLTVDFANAVVQNFIDNNQERQASRFDVAQQEIQAQMNMIENDLAGLKARLEQTDDAVERNQIEAQIAQLQDSLSRYSNAYQSVTLARLQSVDLISVVEPARLPKRPIRPRRSLNALIAAVLGGMAAIGGVFLREMLDTSVKSPDEASELTQSPVLGKIWYEQDIASANGTGAKIVIQKPLSLTAEAFRMLRANLQFASVDTSLRVVLVSSPGPTEGKSTVSLNLALALAAAGRSVILMDADMRRPKVHKYANTEREPGLSDALVDREGDVQQYLKPLAEMDSVRILPAGKTPPNPAELLGSRRMGELLAACQQLVDVVIVDSPPVLAAADAAVLAAQTDGVLLVLEPGSSDRKAVSQSVEQLRRTGATLLGTVLNKVPTDGKGGYYYYYYYYYGEEETSPSFWDRVLPWRKADRGKRQRKRRVAETASEDRV